MKKNLQRNLTETQGKEFKKDVITIEKMRNLMVNEEILDTLTDKYETDQFSVTNECGVDIVFSALETNSSKALIHYNHEMAVDRDFS